MSWKKSPLLTSQSLRLLVSTLAAGEKYPVLNRDTLAIPIQMQLSEKQKSFEYFEQKYDLQIFCISDITDSEDAVR